MPKSSIPLIGLLLANIATSDPKHHVMLALVARLAVPLLPVAAFPELVPCWPTLPAVLPILVVVQLVMFPYEVIKK